MKRQHTARAARAVIILATSCALVAATLEVLATGFNQLVLHRFVFMSFDFPWMIPAGFLLVVVPGTLAVYFLSVLARWPLSLAVIMGLLTTTLIFSILLPYTAVAWWASALLAAGAGVQLSRLMNKRPTNQGLLVLRAVALGLAVAIAVTGVAVRTARAWSEQRAHEALPPAPADAPNVLLIVLDTVRSENLGLYGYGRPTTPELNKAASDATVFNLALSTAPWTLPSHGGLFTGSQAAALIGDWQEPMSDEPATLAEVLGNRGYVSAGFVSNLLYTSYESGLTRGFVHYDDYRLSWPLLFLHPSLSRIDFKSELFQARSFRQAWTALWQSHIAPDGLAPADVFRPADEIATAFLDWQLGVSGRPFFAFLNFFDAHGPYRAPESFTTAFRRSEKLTDQDRYDAAIASMDSTIGNLLGVLRERGILDRTIVVVTSDHGELFGEHGLTGHANSLYLPLLHVPLLIRYPPAVPSGMRVDTLVSLRNLPATILQLAGADPSMLDGEPLSSCWHRPGQVVFGDVSAALSRGINVDSSFRNSRGDMVSRLDGRFHYIRDGDGQEELYDYRADWPEHNNLAADPAFATDLARLRAGIR